MIRKNISTVANLDEVVEWMKNNSEIAFWTLENPITYDIQVKKHYISSITFYNEDECLFYSLKFGLI